MSRGKDDLKKKPERGNQLEETLLHFGGDIPEVMCRDRDKGSVA